MKKIDVAFELPLEVKQANQKQWESLREHPTVVAFKQKYDVDEAFLKTHQGRLSNIINYQKLCIGCSGLFACRQVTTGHVLDAKVEDGVFEHTISYCHYYQEKQDAIKHLDQFIYNDLPESMATIALDDLDLSKETDQYLLTVNACYQWLANPKSKAGFLYGTPGIGKTYLLAAVANQCAKSNMSVAFVHVPTFIAKAKASFDDIDDRFFRLKQEIMMADVCFFDDTGAEVVTPWSRDELLLPIFNARLHENLPTWFSSNEDEKSLLRHYEITAKGEKQPVKAIRIMERIQALATPMYLDGKNRRRE